VTKVGFCVSVLMMFDVQRIRSDFEIFKNHPEMVYLDSAATTHKPKIVVDSQLDYYTKSNSNVHRGNYPLAISATNQYETSRDKVQKFLKAEAREEIIFTRGTTDAINLVAGILCSDLNPAGVGQGFENSISVLQPGDEILVSQMEHHANILPWQIAAAKHGLKLKYVPVTNNLEVDFAKYIELLTPRVKLVAVCHVSNLTGVINPIAKITEAAHQNGSLVLVDGAQAVGHFKVNVQELDVDFYCFSGHKVFSPTGIGVLYGKKPLLNRLPPMQGGGDMIESVNYDTTIYNQLPYKFEAGTPNVAGAVGLAAGLQYFESVYSQALLDWEQYLLGYLQKGLAKISELKLVGTSQKKIGIQAFIIGGIHPLDLDLYLANKNICIRSGFHCVQPLLNQLGFTNGVSRVSLSIYNTAEEIGQLLYWLKKGVDMLR
jgi:cysteine desulfurase / selenocysteine lyase